MEKQHKAITGKNLISMLMFQMYGDSKLIYREYIQNSRDAINDAVKQGILNKLNDGRITVNIDNNQSKITITDNGIGISSENVEPVLLDIANSTKDGENSAGQFGIGRLVGGYFCKKLSFKTSYKGEDVASEIVFDIDHIKAILNDENDNSTATEVIDKTTDKKVEKEDADEHYFIVTLEDINPDYPELLDDTIISDYLKEVAPIDYNIHFKNQLIQTSVHDEYVEFQKQVGHFQITVNNEISIKKKYGLNIKGTGDQILSLCYFPLRDDKYGLLAWGWYAVTQFTKAIPVSDTNSGFRLRKHNIQVGDASLLTDLFPRNETRGNKYFYGEIHIVDQSIKLNSARDGLAPTPQAERLKQRIRDYFDYLVKLYHLANQVKKATEKVIEISEEKDNATTKDLPEITKKWEEAQKEVSRFENTKNAQSSAAKLMIDSYKQKISKATKTVSEPMQPLSHPVKQPMPPANPFEILNDKYSDDELELVKRIFKSFSDNCPIMQKKLIEELKMKVIKDLGR